MDLIQLKYIGGRSFNKVVFNRKPYVFKKDNAFVCECPQELVNWLAQNAIGQFQVVPTKTVIKEVIKEVERKPVLVCDICGFVGKTEHGIIVHKSTKHKGGK